MFNFLCIFSLFFHECPLFSQQQSCCVVSNTQRASIQITVFKLISVSRLKRVHLRQHPCLTTSKPLPHKKTSPVSALLFLHLHGHHNGQETRKQQTVGQLSRSRQAAPELPSRVSKSHPASRDIHSVRPPNSPHVDKSSPFPTFATLTLVRIPGFGGRQLIRLVHGELFSTLL